MITVQTFNSAGDIVACERFATEGGALRQARLSFKYGGGVSINDRDCFTFAEAERALRFASAKETAHEQR